LAKKALYKYSSFPFLYLDTRQSDLDTGKSYVLSLTTVASIMRNVQVTGTSDVCAHHCSVFIYLFSQPVNLTTTTTTVLQLFFGDHPGEPVPEENFWTLSCNGRLTEADTSTIRMGATPSGLVTSVNLHHPPYFLQAGCSSCRPTNSVKAPKELI